MSQVDSSHMKMITFSVNCLISILLFVTVRGTPVPVSSLEELSEENNGTFFVKEDSEPCIVPEEVDSEAEIPTISTDTEDVDPDKEISLLPELKIEGVDNSDLVPDDDIVTADILTLKEPTDLDDVEEQAVPCSDFEEDCNEDSANMQLISVTIPEEALADTILIDQAADPDPEQPSQHS